MDLSNFSDRVDKKEWETFKEDYSRVSVSEYNICDNCCFLMDDGSTCYIDIPVANKCVDIVDDENLFSSNDKYYIFKPSLAKKLKKL